MKRLASGTSALSLLALILAAPAGAQQRPPAAAPSPPPAQGQQDRRPGVGILDFEVGASVGIPHDDLEALRRGLASMTVAELAVNPAVRVVERAQLQQILQEQNLGREGRVDPSTLVQIGRLINARYFVTGTLYYLNRQFRIDSRLFDNETGQIIKTQRVTGTLDNVFDLASSLAQQLMRDANLPPLERRAMEEHQQHGTPPSQAVMAYSRAMLYADRGDTQQAVEQYRRALSAFPSYSTAREACNRLQQGACS